METKYSETTKVFCWRRLLRVPWTAERSNQSILKEINPEYSLEGLMLKLKFQYFGHLMRRTDSLEKTLMLGKIEGKRRRGWQKAKMVGWHHWLNGRAFEQTLGNREGQGGLACCGPWGHKELDMTWPLKYNTVMGKPEEGLDEEKDKRDRFPGQTSWAPLFYRRRDLTGPNKPMLHGFGPGPGPWGTNTLCLRWPPISWAQSKFSYSFSEWMNDNNSWLRLSRGYCPHL